MLRLEDVTAVAGPGSPGDPPKALLRSTRFEVGPGESHLLLGANGAGKTTLIRILTGLRPPAAGRLLLDGAPVRSSRDGRGLWPTVAALFEEPDPQFLSDTVEGEISFGLESLGLPQAEIRSRTREALESFGLLPFAARAPHGLSAGEKARVLLAAALAGRPRVLVLDQATTHLDPGSRRAIEEALIRETLAGARGLVRTHQDAHAPYAGETLHVLHQGELTPAAALTPSAVLALHRTPFPIALRVSALLATQGRWEGPLAADADTVVARLGHAPRPGADARLGAQPASPAWSDSADPPGRASAADNPHHPLLALTGLAWTPPGRRAGPVIEGIDLAVAEGEVVALLGRSGAGKSAILRLACGLMEPGAGAVARAKPAVRRTRPVALALEHPERQLFGRTALEDVGALLWVAGIDAAERDRLARRALAEAGLDPDRFGGRAPLTLSEGEKRRVALAGLLVTPPQVVLLDEPTAGLDPEGRRALAASVQRLREGGRAVLLASHDLDFVGAVADRAVLLAREGEEPGRVLASAPADSLLRHEALLQRAGLAAPDFVRVEGALRAAGLLVGAAPRDGESLLAALARAAVGPGGGAASSREGSCSRAR